MKKQELLALVVCMNLSMLSAQGAPQESQKKQGLIKIVEVSKNAKTTILFAQDQKLGWVELNENNQKPQRKSYKKDSIRSMEMSLTDFVWNYKFKQNISEVKCSDYVEVYLLSTESMARVCRADTYNMSILRPYLKWVRKSLS